MKYWRTRLQRRHWFFAAVITAMIAGTVGAWLWLTPQSPVPRGIQQAVTFPIYYPLQSKLPAGYVLDVHSFSGSNQTVVYTISYGAGQKLVASIQKRPSDEDLANFYHHNMPVHREVLTLAGKATIGAIGEQTVASLPTNDRSWLLITASATVDRDQFSQVLQALIRAK